MKLLIFVARLDFRISGPQRRSIAPPARLLRASGASGVISISAESPFPGNVDLEKVFLPPLTSLERADSRKWIRFHSLRAPLFVALRHLSSSVFALTALSSASPANRRRASYQKVEEVSSLTLRALRRRIISCRRDNHPSALNLGR